MADLTRLSQPQWEAPSLCQGWSVRDLCSHLLMPYELSTGRFLGGIVKARMNFDRLADRWVTQDDRSGPQLSAALAATTAAGFAVPGAGPLAPLAHLTIHSEDVRRPLGLPGAVAAPSAVLVLDDVTSGKHSVGADRLSGLRFVATDADWSLGAGPEVAGTGPRSARSVVIGRALADCLLPPRDTPMSLRRRDRHYGDRHPPGRTTGGP